MVAALRSAKTVRVLTRRTDDKEFLLAISLKGFAAALARLGDDDRTFKEDAAHLLYDEARVLDGDKPADARAFSARLARLIERGLAKG